MATDIAMKLASDLFNKSSGKKSGAAAAEPEQSIFEKHPDITALAATYAMAKVTGNDVLSLRSVANFIAVRSIAEGHATGIIGALEKGWLAYQLGDAAEKGLGGKGMIGFLEKATVGVAAYMLENNLNQRAELANKPAAPAPSTPA